MKMIETSEGFRLEGPGSISVRVIDDYAYISDLKGPGMPELVAEVEREVRKRGCKHVLITVDLTKERLVDIYLKRYGFNISQLVLTKTIDEV